MKIMFISDIHGIKTNIEKITQEFEKNNCTKLVVLGDLFYIGPRNKMNQDYDIAKIVEFLNKYKDKIICIKGNCDSEVDQFVCEFPIIDGVSLIVDNELEMYLTHGHKYNEGNWPVKNSVLIYGHFHIPFIKETESNIFINPGSISLPKEQYKPTYMIYENRKFTIYDIDGKVVMERTV